MKLLNDSTYTVDSAINDFSKRYKAHLDKDTFDSAVADMKKATSAWDAQDIGSVYSNLNFHRFKDTNEVVGHSKAISARKVGRKEPEIYFDKKLAQPHIDKILKKSLKEGVDKYDVVTRLFDAGKLIVGELAGLNNNSTSHDIVVFMFEDGEGYDYVDHVWGASGYVDERDAVEENAYRLYKILNSKYILEDILEEI